MAGKPPSLDIIAKQLQALGATTEEKTEDMVYQLFVDFWKKHKRAPALSELYRKNRMRRSTFDSAIARLVTNGRLFHLPKRGQYVPKVAKD